MGTGIAQVLATAGCLVSLVDTTEAALERAVEEVVGGRFGLRSAVDSGRLDAAQAQDIQDRIEPTTDLDRGVGSADLVVETVFEDLAVKMRLFRELDRAAPPQAVLASNTAGLPIVALAEVTGRPGQVLGWHWSQPVPVMAMAEVIRHEATLDSAVDLVVGLARRCRKNPVVIRDCPQQWGFVANRIMRAVRMESLRVVADGVATEEQVDTLMRDCFRWPMGPFEMWGARRIGDPA